MTAETLKPFIKDPIGSSVSKRENGSKTTFVCHSIVLAVFYAGLLGFVVWNAVRVANLEKEVKHLNTMVETIQKRLGFDLLDDLNEFEEAYGHTVSAGKVNPDKDLFDLSDDRDDYEFDQELNEDTDMEDEDYKEGDIENDEPDYSSSGLEEDDLASQGSNETFSLNFDDSMYDNLDEWGYKAEDDTDKDRKARSISSRSGVPVIEESYSTRSNKTEPQSTMEPTLKYNWNERREQLERKHKKYMEMRTKPASHIRTNRRQTGHLKERNNVVQLGRPIGLSPTPITVPSTQSSDRILTRANRVMHTSEDKSKAFRQDKLGSQPAQVVLTGTRRRTMLPMYKSLEGRGRQRTVAIHYVGDTNRFIAGHHEHYAGNGRLRHPGGVYIDWAVDPSIGNSDRFFRMENGIVTVNENGIYLIYAQIFYHDDHDTNGFTMERNEVPFLQCTTMTHSNQRVTKSNSCYTSGVTLLKTDDTIRISDLGNHRYTLLEPSKSFFGLVKVGAANQQHTGRTTPTMSGDVENMKQIQADFRQLSNQ